MAETITSPDAAPPPGDTAAPQSPVATEAVAPGAFQGWAVLQTAINVQLVQALNRADAVRAATLRVLHGG